jgi:hypothetical protein
MHVCSFWFFQKAMDDKKIELNLHEGYFTKKEEEQKGKL